MLKEAMMEDKQERNLSMLSVQHKQVCDDRSSSGSLTEKRHIISGIHTLT